MKLYNIIINSFVALLLISTTIGCNDFLDKAPENKVNVEEINFTDLSKMFEPVSGVYATVRTGLGFGFWGGVGLLTVRGDDMDKGGTAGDQIELGYAKNFEYNKVADAWILNQTWKAYFNIILISNNALEDLDRFAEYCTTTDQKKLNQQYQAEVRFFRAYAYFYISRLWGDVPLMMSNANLLVGKTPHDQVYAILNQELDFCEKNLPNLHPNEMPYMGQVTSYTAMALRAKVNSDINKWDEVLKATNAIIDSRKFELYSDYYQLFKFPGRLSKESLFELQYTDFGASGGRQVTSDNWFAYQGPAAPIIQLSSWNPVKKEFETFMGGGWGFAPPSKKTEDAFRSRGEKDRFSATLLFYTSVTPSGDSIGKSEKEGLTRFNGKAYTPMSQMSSGTKDPGVGNNIRMLRYADVLLLNAEAKVRAGQNGDEPFNEVRRRAKMPELTNVTLDQILEERFVEFACEWGERFFDLVRTGKAASTLSGFVAGQHEFYPIPQAQIDLNSKLR